MKRIITLLFILIIISEYAVSQTKANYDNYFISPGSRRNLDVLKNDNPGGCTATPENIKLEITNPTTLPSTLLNLEVTADNKIFFRSKASFKGQIEFTYKITCTNDGSSSSAKVYVNVGDKPDFINDAECTIDPLPFVWDIERKGYSAQKVQSYASPVVGDLDGDGILEIVSLNAFQSLPHLSDSVIVFRPDLTVKSKFKVPRIASYVTLPLAIADIDEDGEGEIIIGTTNAPGEPAYVLQAYKWDGTLVWQSSHPYITNIPVFGTLRYSNSIAIADIDGDGSVEIFCGDRIFAGENGNLLGTLPNGGRGQRSFASSVNVHGCLPAIGDIDGDGKMEIVCGNTTYKVTINSRSNPALNSVSILASVPQWDGYTSIADIDGDGILDVVVIADDNNRGAKASSIMYAWQGSTGTMIGTPQNVEKGKNPSNGVIQKWGTGGSRAFIGDINNDGQPEICFTSYCAMNAYTYNKTTKNFVKLWNQKYTSDTSAATTMSMFDFNLDGEVELVYRDETHLRILDKNGNDIPNATFECFSGTHTEYPVVVDLDGDGHAEIIVSGAPDKSVGVNTNVRMMVYGSKTKGTWAPARRVWNQHGYNPLSINEDLSVPSKPLSPTTTITHKDGTSHKPFNSFLQQAGVLNTEGESLNLAPDLSFQAGKSQKMFLDTNTDKMNITTYITNGGSMDFSGNIKLSLYVYDINAATYSLIGSHIFTGQSVAMFEYKTLTFSIPNFSSIPLPASGYLWYTVINLDDNGGSAPTNPYLNQRECNYWNNLSNRMSYISGYLVMCEGETKTVTVDPKNSFDCYWFNPDKTPYPSAGNNKGDSKSVTKKTSNYQEYYLIEVYQKGTNTKISIVPDTIYLYNSPDSLVWTGAVNSDWNEIRNWEKPGDTNQKQQISYIPRACTNVHIPSGLTNYPNLSATGSSFDIYSDAACSNVTLEHGAEIYYSHNLQYSKAYVQLELMSNRWYCFTPPLRDFYPGDIYLTDPNPFNDNMFAYTRRFAQNTSPGAIMGYWETTFNTPNILINAGLGIGLWIDDLDPDNNNHQPMNFNFPKMDSHYYIYDAADNKKYPTSRTNSHRFIFEETINSSTKEVKLSPESKITGQDIMIGNPFMSHLDFEKFYNYGNNKNLIEDHYRIMDSDGSYATYSISGVSTGNPILTKLIAPMQAVLVTPKSAFAANSLVTHPDHTINSAGNKIRSKAKKSIQDVVWVSIADTRVRNRAALIHTDKKAITTAYDKQTDVYKVFKEGKRNPNIYFITDEGYYMDIKNISEPQNFDIRIGLSGDFSGNMALAFEKIWNFATDYDAYLLDKLTGKYTDLRKSSIYTFWGENSGNNTIDDRFVLTFKKHQTSIEQEEDKNYITYTKNASGIDVFSSSGNLDKIMVYDLQGRMVTKKVNINAQQLSINLERGIYLIKADTKNNKRTFKVIIQ